METFYESRAPRMSACAVPLSCGRRRRLLRLKKGATGGPHLSPGLLRGGRASFVGMVAGE